MTNLIQGYLSALIGTGIEIGIFILFYAYFAMIPINWMIVLAFVVLYTLIMGPLAYINNKRRE